MLPALGYGRALEGSRGAPHAGDFTEATSLVHSVSVDRVMEQLARAHLKGFKYHIAIVFNKTHPPKCTNDIQRFLQGKYQWDED